MTPLILQDLLRDSSTTQELATELAECLQPSEPGIAPHWPATIATDGLMGKTEARSLHVLIADGDATMIQAALPLAAQARAVLRQEDVRSWPGMVYDTAREWLRECDLAAEKVLNRSNRGELSFQHQARQDALITTARSHILTARNQLMQEHGLSRPVSLPNHASLPGIYAKDQGGWSRMN